MADPTEKELIPSMADRARLSPAMKASTPAEAVQLLKEGNARFCSGNTSTQYLSAYERRQLIVQQTPFAVVLGCSDSRVPIEIVFDQGLGDLFVVRVAGNVAESSALATIEFAIRFLRIQAVVVMGHEGCGAVQLAMASLAERAKEPPLVRELVESIVGLIDDLPPIDEKAARVRAAVEGNVRLQVQRLLHNETLMPTISRGELAVVGAYYEIASGKVEFLDDWAVA